jgi:phospholipase C
MSARRWMLGALALAVGCRDDAGTREDGAPPRPTDAAAASPPDAAADALEPDAPPPVRCRPRPPAPAPPRSAGPTGTFDKLQQLVIIYLENRSFDHLFGELPGAEGLAQALRAPPQVDEQGLPYAFLPAPFNTFSGLADPRFPDELPNAPFSIDEYIAPAEPLWDLVHRFYQERAQINGGRMNRFAQVSDAAGLTMGYFHTAGLPLAALAREFTVLDHFFHSAYGGSFLNHQVLIAATPPVWEDAPEETFARLDQNGELISDGFVTEDGCWVINTAFSENPPVLGGVVPSQTLPTIGDRLTDKGVSWAWYAGGWKNAAAGAADPGFQFHHQPFTYYARYVEGTPGRAHLQDEADFLAAAAAGTLPAVSFVKPLGPLTEHPGFSTVVAAEEHVVELVEAVRNGPQWRSAAIIITYDENGGFWDHVPPPRGDELGPATRVPSLVVSPFARRGFVDKTIYETVSVLTTIEHRFGLDPLSARDANARDLAAAFDFSRP